MTRVLLPRKLRSDLRRTLLNHLAGDLYYQLAGTNGIRQAYNALRRWHHYLRYGVKSTSMFYNVELEVNSMCNRRCSYCPNVSSTRPPGHMEESLFIKIIDELK